MSLENQHPEQPEAQGFSETDLNFLQEHGMSGELRGPVAPVAAELGAAAIDSVVGAPADGPVAEASHDAQQEPATGNGLSQADIANAMIARRVDLPRSAPK